MAGPQPARPVAEQTSGTVAEETAAPTNWSVTTNLLTTELLAFDGALVGMTGTEQEGSLFGVDPTTGKESWTVPLPGSLDDGGETPVLQGYEVDGQQIVLAYYGTSSEAVGLSDGSSGNVLIAIDIASQEMLWQADAPAGYLMHQGGDETETGLSLSQVAVLADGDPGYGSEHLYGMDVVTGEQRWEVATEAEPRGITDNVLVYMDGTASATGLDTLTGQKLWVYAPGDNPRFGDIRGGSVLITTDSTAAVLDARTGQPKLSTENLSYARNEGHLSPDGATAYVIYPGRSLQTFGAVNWTTELPNANSTSQRFLQVTDEQLRILVAGVVTLDAATGQQIGEVEPEPDASLDAPILLDGYKITRLDDTLTGERVSA